MLPSVVASQACLWMAEPTDDVEDALESIQAAMSWLKVSPLSIERPLVRGSDITVLADVGRFPAEPYFTDLLENAGLNTVLDAKTLASMVSRFLATANLIETEAPVQDAEFSGVNFSPDLYSDVAAPTRDCTESSVCFVALNNQHPSSRGYFLACCRTGGNPLSLAITCQVDASDQGGALSYNPFLMNAILPVLGSPNHFIDALTPASVWGSAQSETELEIAIELQARAMLAAGGGGGAVPAFRVGSEFLPALGLAQAAGSGPYSSVTLSKCAQVLVAPALAAAAPLRTSAAANASQRRRTRDGAGAMRSHITGGHAALRLMHWVLPDGSIEFSTVRNKFDVQIDDGKPLAPRAW